MIRFIPLHFVLFFSTSIGKSPPFLYFHLRKKKKNYILLILHFTIQFYVNMYGTTVHLFYFIEEKKKGVKGTKIHVESGLIANYYLKASPGDTDLSRFNFNNITWIHSIVRYYVGLFKLLFKRIECKMETKKHFTHSMRE